MLTKLDHTLLAAAYHSRCPAWLPVRVLLLTAYIPFIMALIVVLFATGWLFELPVSGALAGKTLLTILFSLVTFIPFKEAKLRLRPYASPGTRKRIPDIENRDPVYGSRERESFPSGHVYTTGMAVVICFSQFGPWSLVATVPYVAAMAYLRMHLGVHYPTDVLAGLLLGAATAAAAAFAYPATSAQISQLWHSDYKPLIWVAVVVVLVPVLWISRRRT